MKMGYGAKVVRSFSRIEPQKLGLGLLAACFLASLTYISVTDTFAVHFRIVDSWLSSSKHAAATSPLAETAMSSPQLDERIEDLEAERKPMCDTSPLRTDVCEMDGDVRIFGKNSSVTYVTPSKFGARRRNESWKIRPYCRKKDKAAMANVREVSLRSLQNYEAAPRCTVNHTVPAILFSIAGYTGNFFHEIADVILPLFLTSYQYNGEVQFVVTNFRIWLIHKYLPVLKKLSHYEIIDFDNDGRVHCFKHAIVGLKDHNEMSIDPSKAPYGYSIADFTRFMRSAYSLERNSPARLGRDPGRKPRLLIITRSRTRKFTNVDEIIWMGETLGFEVVASEADSNVTRFAHVVNSCDVMVGVHGAGLTNLIFLPTNAILIQVLPWVGLDWVANNCYGRPSKEVKLRYLDYQITEEESSLIDQYPRDHAVFKDPSSIHKLGWSGMTKIFFKQNVKLNIRRFRPVLIKALELLHQS